MAGHELGIIAIVYVLDGHVSHQAVVEASNVRLLGHNACHIDVL